MNITIIVTLNANAKEIIMLNTVYGLTDKMGSDWGGIGRPFLAAFAVNVFLLYYGCCQRSLHLYTTIPIVISGC